MSTTPLVAIPYARTEWLPQIVEAVARTGLPYVYVDLSDGDPTGYAQWLERIWSNHADLIIIEHDNVPTSWQVEDLAICNHDWCGFPYLREGKPVIGGLGCTRLSAHLRYRNPIIGRIAARVANDQESWTPWYSLDARLGRYLMLQDECWIGHPGWCSHRGVDGPQTVS